MSDDHETAAPPPPRSPRRLDARSLRGLAHPLRMRVLELLRLDGPATGTALAARLGENTGTVSWHLRHLAEHGFIEEDTGRGTRRERWWRVVERANLVESADFRHDPDARGALTTFVYELVGQYFNRVTHYLGEEWEDEWRGAATVSDWSDLRLTPAQLAALNEELAAVIARHTRPAGTAADPGARPVIVQIQSFPRRGRDER
ncbi:helix-turn-helix domain-containing protein [Streptomyces sp. NPDC050560]|uniref:helix-turn-helix domain-containing protein n=1 Tax=Streptomyces sp. NPDC050560 TaxID=3365630 RepID=UPI00379F14D1